ncbi:hypothetical protein LTR94_037397, partial [Friedmanniomyces endolithicus]
LRPARPLHRLLRIVCRQPRDARQGRRGAGRDAQRGARGGHRRARGARGGHRRARGARGTGRRGQPAIEESAPEM